MLGGDQAESELPRLFVVPAVEQHRRGAVGLKPSRAGEDDLSEEGLYGVWGHAASLNFTQRKRPLIGPSLQGAVIGAARWHIVEGCLPPLEQKFAFHTGA